MPDTIDLTGDIAAAIDGAVTRGATLSLAYVRPDGSPAVSYRGSTQVHGPKDLAIWVRKRDEGLAAAIAENPRVALAYYAPEGPGAKYLSIEGRARVAPEINDEVFAGMVELEQGMDADRNGVAVLIEVDSVAGAGADGFFQQSRA
jgi:hypothetical protein